MLFQTWYNAAANVCDMDSEFTFHTTIICGVNQLFYFKGLSFWDTQKVWVFPVLVFETRYRVKSSPTVWVFLSLLLFITYIYLYLFLFARLCIHLIVVFCVCVCVWMCVWESLYSK